MTYCFLQLIEQHAAHHPNQPGGTRGAQDEHRNPQVGKHVQHLAEAPARLQVLRREQPSDAGPEVLKADIHEDQRQQEVGRRQPGVADDGDEEVPRGVLVEGRVDAYGNGDDVGEHQRRHGHDGGHGQPFPDQVLGRPVIGERPAEIAAGDDSPDPLRILGVDRPVQPIVQPQRKDLLFRRPRTFLFQLGDIGGQVVSGRELDEAECDHGHGQHRQQHVEKTAHDVVDHRMMFRVAAGPAPVGSGARSRVGAYASAPA